MLQTFQSLSEPERVAERVKALRAYMAKSKIDAVLVPRADKHQGEYVPASTERLQWLTGFSGSAGIAVVAKKSAILMVDGRYTVQAATETDPSIFEISLLPRAKLAEWIIANVGKGHVIGFDPWNHTAGEINRLKAALAPKGIKLAVAAQESDRPVVGQSPSEAAAKTQSSLSRLLLLAGLQPTRFPSCRLVSRAKARAPLS